MVCSRLFVLINIIDVSFPLITLFFFYCGVDNFRVIFLTICTFSLHITATCALRNEEYGDKKADATRNGFSLHSWCYIYNCRWVIPNGNYWNAICIALSAFDDDDDPTNLLFNINSAHRKKERLGNAHWTDVSPRFFRNETKVRLHNNIFFLCVHAKRSRKLVRAQPFLNEKIKESLPQSHKYICNHLTAEQRV